MTSNFTRPTAGPQRRLWRLFFQLALAGYILLLGYLSLVSVVPGAPQVSDKLLHFLAYGGLTGLLGLALPTLRLWALFLLASAVGLLLEFGQGTVSSGRMMSAGDQIANMGGAALAVTAWAVIVIVYRRLKPARAN